MKPFDYAAARQAGYSEEEIGRFLAEQSSFDFDGAISQGYRPEEIVDFLSIKAPEIQVAPEAKGGFFRDVGTLLKQGAEQAVSSYQVGPQVIAGDVEGTAGLISKNLSTERYQPEALREVTGAFKDEGEMMAQAENWYSRQGLRAIGGTAVEIGRQLVTNPRGMAYFTAEQAANMVPTLVGAFGGASLGTAVTPGIGTAVGGVMGAFGASAPMEIGAEFTGIIAGELAARGLQPTEENINALLQDETFRDTAISQARVKGTTVAAFDAATSILGGRISSTPMREAIVAATKESLETGASVNALVQRNIDALPFSEKLIAGAKGYAVDVAGAGVGETAGQIAAYGEADLEEVALEVLGEAGGAIVEVPVLAKKFVSAGLRSAQDQPPRAETLKFGESAPGPAPAEVTSEQALGFAQSRFQELQAKRDGTPETETIDPVTGQRVIVPGRLSEFITDDEKAELAFLENDGADAFSVAKAYNLKIKIAGEQKLKEATNAGEAVSAAEDIIGSIDADIEALERDVGLASTDAIVESVTPAPITPAPVTPAPVTPAPQDTLQSGRGLLAQEMTGTASVTLPPVEPAPTLTLEALASADISSMPAPERQEFLADLNFARTAELPAQRQSALTRAAETYGRTVGPIQQPVARATPEEALQATRQPTVERLTTAAPDIDALLGADTRGLDQEDRADFNAQLAMARTAEPGPVQTAALNRAAEIYGRAIGPIQPRTQAPAAERVTTAAPDLDALLTADTRALPQEDRADFNAQLAMARTAEPGPVQTAALNRAAEIYGRAIGPIQPRTQGRTRPEAPRPTRLLGRATETYSAPELQSLANNTKLPEITRRGAQIELRARSDFATSFNPTMAPMRTQPLEVSTNVEITRAAPAALQQGGAASLPDAAVNVPTRADERRAAFQPILDSVLRPGDPKITLGAPTPEAEAQIQEMSSILGSAFGQDLPVVAFSDPSPESPNGFALKGQAFVNVSGLQTSAPRTTLHEFKHVVEQIALAERAAGLTDTAAQEFTEQIESIFDDMSEEGKRSYAEKLLFTAELEGLSGAERETRLQELLADPLLRSEMTADFLGNRAQDKKFWTDLAAADPQGFTGFVERWLAVVNNLLAQLRGAKNQGTKESARVDKYIKDLNRAKLTAQSALINYRKATGQAPVATPAAAAAPVAADDLAPTSEDVVKAEAFEEKYDILPYTSRGQLEIKFSVKESGKYGTHPVLGIPVNKNGTVSLYFPTTNDTAKVVRKDKVLRGETPSSDRIYLTNESSAPKVERFPGLIAQPLGGANVLVQVDPNLVQVLTEYPDGRKDFFMPIAEGAAFKAKMTKLFTLNVPRGKGLSPDRTLLEIQKSIATAATKFKEANRSDRKALVSAARKVLRAEHNVGTLLGENGKLEKTRIGDYGLTYDGQSVSSLGLGLASAQKINDKQKLTSCPQSAICEDLCLGETSGQNMLYGGIGQFRSGPRLSQYLKTEAMVLHPEEFTTVLMAEIDSFRVWSAKEEYKSAIRLNVTSDFVPKILEPIITAFPDVMFYDYTKMNTDVIAPNHHLTYSSTGASQVVNGETIINPESNWPRMVQRMRNGQNVAMAFTVRNDMPDFVQDEVSGERFQVWNGDNYDARFLDPKPGEPGNTLNKGMIIGLTNKDRTGPTDTAAKRHKGFFLEYDRARDGDTLIIKDQSALKETVARPVKLQFSRKQGDVLARDPRLEQAAQGMKEGTVTSAEYRELVNAIKPVTPYTEVPDPAKPEDIRRALTSDKLDRIGVPGKTLKAGDPVGLRLDIPAYANHGVWVVSVHDQIPGFAAGKSIGYESVASVTNPTFGVVESAALNIASGKPKATIAVMKGDWKPISPKQAAAAAKLAMKSDSWVQVGMDPTRHAYFYDRASMEPVVSADEAIQVGPLVLAKNPVYGSKEDFRFSRKQADDTDGPVRIRLGRTDNTAANKALDSLQAKLAANPLNDRELMRKGAGVSLSVFNGALHISDIRSTAPGQGEASELLDLVIAEADAAGTKLTLFADSYAEEGGLSTEALVDWYSRRGFEVFDESDDGVEMRRFPNPEAEPQFSRKQGDAPSQQRGINVRNDGDNLYADLIVDGEKTMESRNTNSLRAYVGQTVGIIRTGGGPARLIGSVKIGEPIQVDEQEFRELEPEHLVPKDSTFDIKPGSTKFLYPLTEAQRFDEERAVDSRGIVARDVAFSRKQGGDDELSAARERRKLQTFARDFTAGRQELAAQIAEATADADQRGMYDDLSVDDRLQTSSGHVMRVLGKTLLKVSPLTRAPMAGMPSLTSDDIVEIDDKQYTPALRVETIDPNGDVSQGHALMFRMKNRYAKMTGPQAVPIRGDSANDIRFSVRQPPFYSSLKRTVADLPERMRTQPAKQWVQWLTSPSNQSRFGFKKEEVTWSGVEEYLNMRGKDKVTADDIIQYLNENNVTVEDVVLGGEQELGFYPENTWMEPESGEMNTLANWREEMQRIADAEDLDVDDLMGELVNMSFEPIPADDPNISPKYANYVAGQGDNYREVLITLPYKGGKVSGQVKFISEDVAEEFMEELSMQGLDKLDYGADTSDRSLVVYDQLTEPEYNRFAEVRDQWATASTMTVMRTGGDPKQKGYMSSHWYAPNVLAHLRVDDRATAAGESVLFVNEVQSDWGQDARKKGIKPQFTMDELIDQRYDAAQKLRDKVRPINFYDRELQNHPYVVLNDSADNAEFKKLLSAKGVTSPALISELSTLATAYRAADLAVTARSGKPEGTIPNAPFIVDTESWATLAIKRAVVMAVDGEYDKVAFVNGEQAAEMFDLSKRVGEIHYNEGDDLYSLTIYDPDGDLIHRENNASADEVSDVIGKELANKIVNGEGEYSDTYGARVLSGLDLKVGGEGMVGFYDGIVPNLLRKLAKKFGGTVAVEPVQVSPGSSATTDQLTLTITDDLRKQVQDIGLPLFSRKQNIFGQTMPPSNWTAEEGKMDETIYSLQDKLVDTKRVLQGIRKAGNTIADKWDGYLQETLYHGRTATRTTDFIDDELAPLIKGMGAGSVSMKEFDTYLHNRHAQERNAAIARINPALPDAGSGIKSADARAYLAAMDPNRRATLESLAQKVDAITEKTRQALLAGGLESQAAIDAWESTYSQYVPLMREELDFDPSGGKGGSGAGFNVKGNSSRRATGSSTRAVVDILANIAMQRERAIVRAEKNRVSQAMYGLAIQNPNPGFWLPINPDAIKDKTAFAAELVAMGINPLQAQNIAEQPTQPSVDPRTGLVRQVNSLLADNPNVLVTRVNGKDRFLLFNSQDERANRMVKALKNMDADQLGRALSMFAVGTRWFASVNTQYNPIFGVINFARDVQGGLLNLSTTAIAGKQKDVTKNTIPALIGIYRDLRSGTPSQWATLWEDFQQAGGQTGFRDQFSQSEERGKALQKELDALRAGTAKKAGKAVLNWLSDYNTAMENAVRLSAYKVALDNGLSKDRAASLAKNLTVNFNKKGQAATNMGALYAFFNASVQGSARLLETLKGPAGKKIVYGGLLLGSAQALAMAAAGFDEDEPPQFLRERNIIIPIGDKKYLAVPMPLGFNVIPNTGRILTEWAMSGFENTGARTFDLIGSFADMFNPIGNAGFSGQTIMPTVTDPFMALFENRDWSGNPISKENFSGLAPTPGYTRAKDTASWAAKQVSYYLNLASGGTEFAPGAISPTPDQLDYFGGQFFGGIGREVLKLDTTVTALLTGEDLPPFKIPLFGRLYGDTSTSAADSNRFYENIRRMNIHKEEIEGRQKTRRPVGEYYRDNPEARLVTMAGSVYRDVQQMRNRKREMVERGASRESVRIMEQRIASRMRQFNDQLARM